MPLLEGTEFKLFAGDGNLPSDGCMTVVVNGGFLIGDISGDRKRLERGLFTGRFSIDELGEATPAIGMCDINASVIETLFGQFADIRTLADGDGVGMECDSCRRGSTVNGVGGQIAGLAASSRPRLEPCANSDTVGTDRCYTTEWAGGRTRAQTCSGGDLETKAARFDALPDAIQIPVPTPDALY